MSTIIKGSTKRGQHFIKASNFVAGRFLTDIYGTHSTAKENAWNWCFEKYLKTDERDNFRITGYNSMMFTVAWNGLYDGERALFIETRSNSYIILLDK